MNKLSKVQKTDNECLNKKYSMSFDKFINK